jgi:membrane protease YdiL (CAAX protease family)
LTARVGDFLFPDRIRPPRWKGYGARWLLALTACALWAAGLFLIRSRVGGAAAHLLDAGWAAVLLIVGLCVCGPARVRAHLAATEWGRLVYHVALVVFLLVMIDRLRDWEAVAPGAAGNASLPPKALMAARILAVGLLRPVAEEFAFRFVLFRALRARLPFSLSTLISSVAFGLMHLWQGPPMAISAVLAGVLLCWSLERTRSVATPVIAHVLFNLLSA